MENKNKQEGNIVLGTNSDIISEKFRNYVPKIYEAMDFFKIPFDINDLDKINRNSEWCPAEEDKFFMSQNAYDEAVAKYNKKRSELLFDNVFVHYESCDCGGGYPCNHDSFPTEIEIVDTKNNLHHLITIDSDDCLIFGYGGDGGSEIQIYGLKNFTYGDFIRFCKLCDINLESKYIL